MRVLALIAVALVGIGANAQDQRTILVDVFTNSHCSPCRSMHNAMDTHVGETQRSANVVEIYNHIRVYADDALYQYNTTEPFARGQHLGGVRGTPTAFISGARFQSSWSGIGTAIDAALAQEVRYSITSDARVVDDMIVVNVTVQNLTMDDTPVALYGVVVEDVMYRGRNGVEDRKNVYRRGLTTAEGTPLTFNEQGVATLMLEIPVDEVWDLSMISVVTAVQAQNGTDVFEANDAPLNMATSVQEFNDAAPIDRVEVFNLMGELVRVFTVDGTSYASRLTSLNVPTGAYLFVEHQGQARRSVLQILQ